jgi:hypothetical protein
MELVWECGGEAWGSRHREGAWSEFGGLGLQGCEPQQYGGLMIWGDSSKVKILYHQAWTFSNKGNNPCLLRRLHRTTQYIQCSFFCYDDHIVPSFISPLQHNKEILRGGEVVFEQLPIGRLDDSSSADRDLNREPIASPASAPQPRWRFCFFRATLR